MSELSPPSEPRSGKRLVLGGLVAVLALVVAAVLSIRSLLPAAGKLRIGDPIAVVTEHLGEPDAEYGALEDLLDSELVPMGFEFTPLTHPEEPRCKAEGLPDVPGRALWFPFGPTAGTLVYLDPEDRVANVFSGGT